jgi:four helix bundle protein
MAGWTTVDEIIAYQLSVKLRDQIVALVESGRLARDFKFRDQMRDAARSAPSNLSEGFYRYNHGEFAYHASVAKASLGELKNHLQDARTGKYITEEVFTQLFALAKESMKTTSGLLRYLRSSKAPKVWPNPPTGRP